MMDVDLAVPAGAAFRLSRMSLADAARVLPVYQACEDFLALGPVATASLEMVQTDLRHSEQLGSQFFGIFLPGDVHMAGILDVLPSGWDGDPTSAFLELLMIGAPYRGQGLGHAVVEWLAGHLRACGMRRVASGVQANNPGAIRFWLRHCFLITAPAALMPDTTTAYPLVRWL